jgi:hypothetical protein
MRVVTEGGIQKAIRLGYDVAGQIGIPHPVLSPARGPPLDRQLQRRRL